MAGGDAVTRDVHPIMLQALRLIDLIGAGAHGGLCDAVDLAHLYDPTPDQIHNLQVAMNDALQAHVGYEVTQ